MLENSIHHHNQIEITAMKHEIKNIETHFATKADMMKWTVGVGVATVLAITGIMSGMLFGFDSRITSLDSRLTGVESRLIRVENEQKEMRQAVVEISKKIDILIANNKK